MEEFERAYNKLFQTLYDKNLKIKHLEKENTELKETVDKKQKEIYGLRTTLNNILISLRQLTDDIDSVEETWVKDYLKED